MLITHLSRRKRETLDRTTIINSARCGSEAANVGRDQRQRGTESLARAVNERLDRMTHKVGTDLNESGTQDP